MAGGRGRLPGLGELEQEVLEHLWRVESADVAGTHAAIGKPRRISPNTVGSALERLHRKGLARRDKVSHAYQYRASLARDEFYARRAIEAAGGVGALARGGVLAAFVNLVGASDPASLDRLERLIARRRGGPP